MPPLSWSTVLRCSQCGTKRFGYFRPGDLLDCAACVASYRKADPPPPGRILLRPDLTTGPQQGWAETGWSHAKGYTFEGGRSPSGVAELVVRAQPERVDYPVVPVLWTDSLFHDCEVLATFRLAELHPDDYVGLALRSSQRGVYRAFLSGQGTFSIDALVGREFKGKLVDWARHDAIRPGSEAPNRLRFSATGGELRFYLNDVLVATLHDQRYQVGRVELLVHCTLGPATFGVSELAVRRSER